MKHSDRRPRLIGAAALLALSAAALLALYLLFPTHERLALERGRFKPDAVSIAYMEAMLRSTPRDVLLRLQLARMLVDAGRGAEAERVLAGLDSNSPAVRRTAKLLRLRIRVARFTALAATDSRRRAMARALGATLSREGATWRTPADLEQAIRLALLIERPDLAARFAAKLAERQPAQAAKWWSDAGEWDLQAGEQLAAAEAYWRAGERGDSRAAARRALDAARQAGTNHPARLLRIAERALQRFPADRAVSRRAIALAQALHRDDLALAWNTRLLRSHSDDVTVLRRQRELALAVDDLKAAQAAARRLVRVRPGSIQDRETLATIDEWGGDVPGAEAQWRWLADHHRSRRFDLELARLAVMNYDYPTLARALARLQRRYGLGAKERDQLVATYLILGQPDQAVATLTRYIRRHPNDRGIRVRLAKLQVYAEEPGAAKKTWHAIGRRFGMDSEVRFALMRLDWQTYRLGPALGWARRSKGDFARASDYELAIAGELAWRNDDPVLLRDAYGTLWKRPMAFPLAPERLALEAALANDIGGAATWAQRAWRRYHDALIVLQIMPMAVKARRWDLVRQMLNAGHQAPALTTHLEYWLIRAELASHNGASAAAVAAYRHALAIAPGSSAARTGLLWTLLAAHDDVQLRQALRRWQADARTDSSLWGVFAAAYAHFGETRLALVYYAREMKLRPRDYLWAASYAQALEQAGDATAAWRMRRYALAGLRTQAAASVKAGKADGDLLDTTAELSLQLTGAPAAARWVNAGLATRSERSAAGALISWYLAEDRPDAARFWLLRQRLVGDTAPVWQRLAVAIADEDLPRVARLLRSGGLTLADRVSAERALGHRARALADALSGIGRNEAGQTAVLRQAAAELSAELPNDVGAALSLQRLGGLDMARMDTEASLSRGTWTLNANVSEDRLFADPSVIDLGGSTLERRAILGFAQRTRRTRMSLYAGVDRVGTAGLAPWGVGFDYTWSPRLSVSVDYAANALTHDSAALRVAGAVDRLAVSVDADFSAREFASIVTSRNRYHSRAGGALGQGYGIDWSLGQHEWRGANRLDVSFSGSWMQNRLADMLPRDLARMLPSGATVGDVLPGDYRSAGLGVDLARGNPETAYPDVASPRYALHLWSGWVWPENKPAWRAQVSVGTRVLGGDDLRLSAFYDSAAGQAADQSSSGITLGYRWFFGR